MNRSAAMLFAIPALFVLFVVSVRADDHLVEKGVREYNAEETRELWLTSLAPCRRAGGLQQNAKQIFARALK